jgi:hypothetical protein
MQIAGFLSFAPDNNQTFLAVLQKITEKKKSWLQGDIPSGFSTSRRRVPCLGLEIRLGIFMHFITCYLLNSNILFD